MKMEDLDWKSILEKEIPKHYKPSQGTLLLFKGMEKEVTNIKVNMAKVETKMENIETKLDQHCKEQRQDFDKMHDNQKEFTDKIESMFTEAMKGKANKWVETAIRWFLYTVAGLAVSGMSYLIVRATIHLLN